VRPAVGYLRKKAQASTPPLIVDMAEKQYIRL